VEVPGIGVFKKIHVPASYDEVQSAFLPPVTHIELTEGHADVFPIAVYLQAQQQVDGPTAALILEKAVNDIMESISRNGEALLDGVGYLLADGASFVFRPFEIGGSGWKPIRARRPIINEKEAVGAPKELLVDNADAEIAVADKMARSKSRTIWWVSAAVLLVLLSAAGAVWYYRPITFDRTTIAEFFGRKGEEHNQAGNQEPPKAETPLIVDEADSIVVDTTKVAALVIDSIPHDSAAVEVAEAAKPSVTYEIIVGSFATMAQAKKFVTEMKAKGYDLQAIDSRMPGNRKKISWGSFATEEEAYRELARVQKNFEPGAWIAKVAHD